MNIIKHQEDQIKIKKHMIKINQNTLRELLKLMDSLENIGFIHIELIVY